MSEIVNLKIELDHLRNALDEEIFQGECLQTIQKIYYVIQEIEGSIITCELSKITSYN